MKFTNSWETRTSFHRSFKFSDLMSIRDALRIMFLITHSDKINVYSIDIDEQFGVDSCSLHETFNILNEVDEEKLLTRYENFDVESITMLACFEGIIITITIFIMQEVINISYSSNANNDNITCFEKLVLKAYNSVIERQQ